VASLLVVLLSACSWIGPQDEVAVNDAELKTMSQLAAEARAATEAHAQAQLKAKSGVKAKPRSSSQDQPKNSVSIAAFDENTSVEYINALLEREKEPLTTNNVGFYMDVQYANLQQKLKGNVTITSRHKQDINITFPSPLAFVEDSASIKEPAEAELSSIAEVISQYSKTLVIIEGHADNQGDLEANQKLSEKRALAVGQYLAKHNVAPERLLITGFGSVRPKSSNETEAGRERNRRIEIIITPVIARSASSQTDLVHSNPAN
jgi:outer membrane protein OmpA-like peptidoglycan-associated protein